MENKEQRYFELASRRSTLVGILEKMESEFKENASSFLFKVLEPEAEKHHVETVVFLKRWIREVEEEAEKLEFDVMAGAFAEHLQTVNEGLKNHEE